MHRLLSQLNRRIAKEGEVVTMSKPVGTGQTQTFINSNMPAIVKPLTEKQLVGAVAQLSFMIILSPTTLIASGWPQQTSPLPPWRFPLLTDKIILRGQTRAITRAVPIYIKTECVRIELLATG
jgi:hypothetical protein